MAKAPVEAWRRLWQQIRQLWRREQGSLPCDTGTPPLPSPDEPGPDTSQHTMPPPAPDHSQYRSKPDPAFGSRSAAQREAYEKLQQMREAEARRDAETHSRERLGRPEQSS